MKAAKYFFFMWAVLCFILGFYAPHHFATAAFSFLMCWACSVQEQKDNEWEDKL